MRKPVLITCSFLVIVFSLNAQKNKYTRSGSIGIHFIFNDFETASLIRRTSLSQVLNNGQFGDLKKMYQGLALSYSRGIAAHFDFTSMFTGAMLSYPLPDRPPTGGAQSVLFECDASVRGKMFTDEYIVVPYLQIGAGASKYQGYWGAFIPVGLGLQVNFFDEAFLVINSQYRIAVTETTNYHFIHSIGIAANMGKRD